MKDWFVSPGVSSDSSLDELQERYIQEARRKQFVDAKLREVVLFITGEADDDQVNFPVKLFSDDDARDLEPDARRGIVEDLYECFGLEAPEDLTGSEDRIQRRMELEREHFVGDGGLSYPKRRNITRLSDVFQVNQNFYIERGTNVEWENSTMGIRSMHTMHYLRRNPTPRAEAPVSAA